MRILPFLFLLVLFLTGCATKIDWSSRVGRYNYDDAIRELGVPDRSAMLSDGSTVAEWLRRRGGAYGTVHGFGYSRLDTFDINQFPDSYVRLIFGPDHQLVKAENFAR